MRGRRTSTMNTAIPIISFLALALASTTLAQAPRSAVMEQLRIKRQELPIYPHELVRLGVRERRAWVVFRVDVAGRVDDCLPIAYPHKEFAEATLAVACR